MNALGFKAAKKAVLAALKDGDYQHADRNQIDVKNLLAVGDVSAQEIIDVIRRCDGTHYQSSPHHQIKSVECHVIKAQGWYIKFYFVDPATFFISVHQ